MIDVVLTLVLLVSTIGGFVYVVDRSIQLVRGLKNGSD